MREGVSRFKCVLSARIVESFQCTFTGDRWWRSKALLDTEDHRMFLQFSLVAVRTEDYPGVPSVVCQNASDQPSISQVSCPSPRGVIGTCSARKR